MTTFKIGLVTPAKLKAYQYANNLAKRVINHNTGYNPNYGKANTLGKFIRIKHAMNGNHNLTS